MNWLSFLFAFGAGAFITVQAGANSQLKRSLMVPFPAVVANYVVGLGSVLLYMLIRQEPLADPAKFREAPWWAWTGGVFGTFYGVATVFLAQAMGAATLTSLVVTGQLICSVLLDHYGWVGFDPHPANWGRLTGCVLMVAGLFLIAKY